MGVKRPRIWGRGLVLKERECIYFVAKNADLLLYLKSERNIASMRVCVYITLTVTPLPATIEGTEVCVLFLITYVTCHPNK